MYRKKNTIFTKSNKFSINKHNVSIYTISRGLRIGSCFGIENYDY